MNHRRMKKQKCSYYSHSLVLQIFSPSVPKFICCHSKTLFTAAVFLSSTCLIVYFSTNFNTSFKNFIYHISKANSLGKKQLFFVHIRCVFSHSVPSQSQVIKGFFNDLTQVNNIQCYMFLSSQASNSEVSGR